MGGRHKESRASMASMASRASRGQQTDEDGKARRISMVLGWKLALERMVLERNGEVQEQTARLCCSFLRRPAMIELLRLPARFLARLLHRRPTQERVRQPVGESHVETLKTSSRVSFHLLSSCCSFGFLFYCWIEADLLVDRSRLSVTTNPQNFFLLYSNLPALCSLKPSNRSFYRRKSRFFEIKTKKIKSKVFWLHTSALHNYVTRCPAVDV